jgi:hypothetical protein
VTIEAKPGFQPQAVARAKADRQHVGIAEQHRRQRFGIGGRHRNLEPVLAGVAGARHEAVEAGNAARARVHELHGVDVRAEFGQRAFRLRSLQRDQRAVGEGIDDAAVGQVGAQMRLVLGLAGGVDHHEQAIAEIGDHQIVEQAAVLVGELRVALPTRRHRNDVLGHQALQRQRGVLEAARLRAQRDLAHVGDVEQTGGGAGMQMFLQHPGRVLHGHVIAGERHHLRAAREMQRVQWRLFQGGRICKHHRALSAPGNRSRKPPRKPHLSLCLRVLSRRRTRFGRSSSAPLSRCRQITRVLLPESFRGGCSFGAGTRPVSPDVTVVEQVGRKHAPGKPVNAAKALSTGFVYCGNLLIWLHSFWTPGQALSKSVCPADKAFLATRPRPPIG